jgi:hypothetical protein
VAELEPLGRRLLEDPRDREAWQELAKWAARGHPPPVVLWTQDFAQAAWDEGWRGAPIEGLPELVGALRVAVPDADLVEVEAEAPGLIATEAEPAAPRGPGEGPTAWPVHPDANRLVVGPAPDFLVTLQARDAGNPGPRLSRLWRWSTRELLAEGNGPAAFSADERWVVLADREVVQFRQLAPPYDGWVLEGFREAVVALRFAGGECMVLTAAGVAAAVDPATQEARVFPVRWPDPVPERVAWTRHGLVYQHGYSVFFTDARGRVVSRVGEPGERATLEAVDPLGFGVVLRRPRRLQAYSTGGERVEELGWTAHVACVGAATTMRLALSEIGQLYLHEPSTPERTQPLLILPGREAPAAAFRPAGKVMVLTAGGLLREWDPANGGWEPAEDFRGFPGGVRDLALGPSGDVLGVRDGEGGVWESHLHGTGEPWESTAERLRDFMVDLDAPAPPGLAASLADEGITAYAAHEARQEVAVGLADGAVELRPVDAAGGTPQRRIEAHDGPVTALRYGPGGRYLLSGGSDGRVVVHRLGLAPFPPPPAPPG